MATKKTEAKKKEAAAAAAPAKRVTAMSKTALVSALVESQNGEVSRKHVKAILDALVDVAYKELKKNEVFAMPGFAKFRIVSKPATKARPGFNPKTREPITIPAKPKSRTVRARVIKVLKEAV
ncbi:MAG: HU family DNA-binding protein [Polyangiaceae bacterium]